MDDGVRVVWIANLDNLGAAIDPLVLGKHLDGGAPLTVEVVEKVPGDRGGSPFRVDGRPVILESFRVPEDVDEDSVGVFNTNTFLVDAAELRDLDMLWTWFRVEKSVDGRPAIQFERLIGELTSALRSIVPAGAARRPRVALHPGQGPRRAGRQPRRDLGARRALSDRGGTPAARSVTAA